MKNPVDPHRRSGYKVPTNDGNHLSKGNPTMSASYHDKHWSQWTPADHRAYLRDEAAQRLATAKHNGFNTAEEHEAMHNWHAEQERIYGV